MQQQFQVLYRIDQKIYPRFRPFDELIYVTMVLGCCQAKWRSFVTPPYNVFSVFVSELYNPTTNHPNISTYLQGYQTLSHQGLSFGICR